MLLVSLCLLVALFVVPAASAAPLTQEVPQSDLATLFLGILGAGFSLLFTYQPKARAWLMSFENKGLVMVGILSAVAIVYFGLSCTPFAGDLNISLPCTKDSAFDVLKAVYYLAVGNQLTFLLTRS